MLLKSLVFQLLSHVWLVTPWTAACQASLSFTISQHLLKFMSIELVMPSNHFIPSCPLLLLLSIFASISLFQWVNSSHQVAKVLELQLQLVLPMNIQGWFPLGLTGLISLESPSDSQESSPTPQFDSINSSAFSLLYDWLVWSPCCSRDSQESSPTPVQRHQFFSAQPSLWSTSHICTWLLEKPYLWLYRPLSAS